MSVGADQLDNGIYRNMKVVWPRWTRGGIEVPMYLSSELDSMYIS